MPIVENDPWRAQYFTGVRCPDDVVIPTDDPEAYRLYPAHRWVYDKLRICETQRLEHGPHGVAPRAFPVFSKPIYNLRGMGVGGRVLRSRAEYDEVQTPGHLWMPLLTGAHVSTDVAVEDGVPRWWRHTVVNFFAGVLVLAAGLWHFGVDGKMATYAALVAVIATTQWFCSRGWKG